MLPLAAVFLLLFTATAAKADTCKDLHALVELQRAAYAASEKHQRISTLQAALQLVSTPTSSTYPAITEISHDYLRQVMAVLQGAIRGQPVNVTMYRYPGVGLFTLYTDIQALIFSLTGIKPVVVKVQGVGSTYLFRLP